MKSHYSSRHTQRMHDLFVGMNEALKNEKREWLFEMQPTLAADLRQLKQDEHVQAHEARPIPDYRGR